MSDVVNKLWGFCHTLRHDGIDYGDYIEQLTYLLFLKMAEERAAAVPKGFDWASLKNLSGTELTDHYADILRKLREAGGLLADIFAQATPRFNNPVNLKRVIAMIDEEDWSAMDVDVKGAAFEGLLEKAASEGKKGAGQYFTPRVLIKSIVRVMKPDPRGKPEFTIADPAVGTGGFLVCSYEWLIEQAKGVFDRADARRIKTQTYYGQDLVPRPRRLALMNLFLHGVEPHIYLGDTIYEPFRGERNDIILTNPPFGTKGANQAPEREDFTIETSNKQLNFVQHVLTALKPGGRAAIVLPDNCLFEGKAGEVFEILMQDCNLHTILRLPRGTFTPYSPGVKANVIFFQKGPPTQHTWIFDARSNVPGITKKERPLSPQHFAEFEKSYGADPNGTSKRLDTGEAGRFRRFPIAYVREREYKLDITWLRDESVEDSDELPEPQNLASEAITELEAVVDDLREIVMLEEHDESQIEDNESLPKGWVACLLGDVVRVQNGFAFPAKEFQTAGIPVIRQSNLAGDRVSLEKCVYVDPRWLKAKPDFILRKNDVLIGMSGSVGKLCIYDLDQPALQNQRTGKIVPCSTQLIDWRFVWEYLKTIEQQLLEKGKGMGILNVSAHDIESLPFRLAPLNEQRRIVAKLGRLLLKVDACRHRLATVTGALPKLERLTQSILAKAFRGELVPQDPNDEPASELLKRIKS